MHFWHPKDGFHRLENIWWASEQEVINLRHLGTLEISRKTPKIPNADMRTWSQRWFNSSYPNYFIKAMEKGTEWLLNPVTWVEQNGGCILYTKKIWSGEKYTNSFQLVGYHFCFIVDYLASWDVCGAELRCNLFGWNSVQSRANKMPTQA